MIITTSRKPSRRTRSFCKELQNFLGAEYITRGKLSMEEIFGLEDRLIHVSERNGNPSRITMYRNREPAISLIIKGIGMSKKTEV